MKLFFAPALSILLAGCASPLVQYELMPTVSLVSGDLKPIRTLWDNANPIGIDPNGYQAMAETLDRRTLNATTIEVYKDGMTPPKSVIFFAKIIAYGESGISKKRFEQELINEAKRLGAQLVYISGSNTAQTGSMTGYYGNLGVSFSQNTYTTQHYGLAGVYAKSTAGIVIDSDGTITFVYPSSPAEEAGITEGDKVLAINNVYIKQDPFVVDREIKSKTPDSVVKLTILDRSSNKKQVSLKLIKQ